MNIPYGLSGKVLRNLLSAFAISTALLACSEPSADDGEPQQSEGPAVDMGAQLGPAWTAIGKVSQQSLPDGVKPDELAVAKSGTKAAGDGRYTSTLVLADGTAYRREGEAPHHEFDPSVDTGARPGETLNAVIEKFTVLIGADNRTAVTADATLQAYPARTVGTILYSAGATLGGCTGTMIGPRHVLTAAHCIYDGGSNWYWPLYFGPGKEGTADRNGAPRAAVARYARTFDLGWDYGIIVLADEQSTASLGWMGIGWYNQLSGYNGRSITTRGYPHSGEPCAGSPIAGGTCGGLQYFQNTTLPSNIHQNGYLYSTADRSDGESGGPLYEMWSGSPTILGVYKRGNENGSGASITATPATYTIFPRTRQEVFNDVCSWMQLWPSAFAAHPFCS